MDDDDAPERRGHYEEFVVHTNPERVRAELAAQTSNWPFREGAESVASVRTSRAPSQTPEDEAYMAELMATGGCIYPLLLAPAKRLIDEWNKNVDPRWIVTRTDNGNGNVAFSYSNPELMAEWRAKIDARQAKSEAAFKKRWGLEES